MKKEELLELLKDEDVQEVIIGLICQNIVASGNLSQVIKARITPYPACKGRITNAIGKEY